MSIEGDRSFETNEIDRFQYIKILCFSRGLGDDILNVLVQNEDGDSCYLSSNSNFIEIERVNLMPIGEDLVLEAERIAEKQGIKIV